MLKKTHMANGLMGDFIHGLELAGIRVNRKMLAELAVNNPEVFAKIVEEVKKVLPPQGEAADLDELRKRFGKPTAKKEAVPKKEEVKKEEKEEKAEVKEEEKTEE